MLDELKKEVDTLILESKKREELKIFCINTLEKIKNIENNDKKEFNLRKSFSLSPNICPNCGKKLY